ncbi:hypothetical protein HAX54_004045 [Datura stramonium]|uniref:PUM-HD domain-containing protein n=1 Tax=Datura stramonium TaxID=4076 RepID=A0ABS8T740_DATST|nr:hypothetical protein [Datura stramonium]
MLPFKFTKCMAVLQKALEVIDLDQKTELVHELNGHVMRKLSVRCIVHEILESAYALAQDQYGNYVTQHVLERGRARKKSNYWKVDWKCCTRELLIEEILAESEGNDCLLTMMKDQFANYVVQKILEISNNKHREFC